MIRPSRYIMLVKRVQMSTIVLVTIAMFDLVTTLLLLAQGFGESNPIFNHLLETGGIAAFVSAKIFLVAGPILLLEYVRKHRPESAEQGTWIAAGFYGMLYVMHLVRHLV
jgi:hypothetical protein